MKSIFFKGEKKELINIVIEAVINHQITVKKIIAIIELLGELSNYGYDYEDILKYRLKKARKSY